MSGACIALFMAGLGGGGAERIMLTLAEAFIERGYSVDLVVTKARGALVNDVPEGVRLVDLGAPRIILSLPALVRYFRREKPTVMLSALASANCVAVWARKISHVRTRLILAEHSTLSLASTHAATRRARLMPIIMRRTYWRADGVVAVSEGVAHDLAATIKLPRERIDVIYNPAKTPRVHKLSREPLSHEWFGDFQNPVILSVGRLIAAKDYATLLRAFAIVRKKFPARLVILGEGEERQPLEQLAQDLGIRDDVSFPGFVTNPYNYMRAAAVFVLSSRWEGLPTVLIEAMACGTPVVSTNCPSGPAEILEDGYWGRLVPVEDPQALAVAIKEGLENDVPTQEGVIQRAAFFSSDHAIDQYRAVLCQGAYSGVDRRSKTRPNRRES